MVNDVLYFNGVKYYRNKQHSSLTKKDAQFWANESRNKGNNARVVRDSLTKYQKNKYSVYVR